MGAACSTDAEVVHSLDQQPAVNNGRVPLNSAANTNVTNPVNLQDTNSKPVPYAPVVNNLNNVNDSGDKSGRESVASLSAPDSDNASEASVPRQNVRAESLASMSAPDSEVLSVASMPRRKTNDSLRSLSVASSNYEKVASKPDEPKGTEATAAPPMPAKRRLELPESEKLTAALQGRLDVEYPRLSRVIRIFTSSTFTDTQVERNTLMEKVYPRLKTFCQERGYDFQVVDMRWGVRDEATTDHMTSELCMRELAECQKLSTGPNFITFLGQKYGYRPFPPKIEAVRFEKMLAATQDEADRNLLSHWFARDDNSVPPFYLLQPITSKLPDYVNETDPKSKKLAQDKWWSSFERMQVVLRQAADRVIEEGPERHRFYCSVTEEEIANGILNAANVASSCFWFKRVITDLVDNASSKKARLFMDISGSVDKEAQTLLSQLKDKRLKEKLPAKNVKTYKVKWSENGIDPQASEEHRKYIATLSTDFYSVLTGMIQAGMQTEVGISGASPLQLECLSHATFAQKKCDSFYGRQDLLDRMKQHIKQKPSSPLVLCGQPGSGKTSLMARAMEMAPEWCGKTCLVVGRFLGTSTASSGIQKLLSGLCQQLAAGCGQSVDSMERESMKHLKAELLRWLETCCDRKPVFLCLDSLDQLDDTMDGRDMAWLPRPLPKNARLVMSTLPDDVYSVLPNLKLKYSDITYLDVPLLKDADISDILRETLGAKGRELQGVQLSAVKSACEKCATPLYMKIVLDEAATWKSYTKSDHAALTATVETAINALLEKVERYHGRILVTHVLSFITCAKSGLSENEIEDIISCDDEVLNDVYQYHTPPLRRLPPLLWVRIRADLRDYLIDRGADGTQVITWYHRQFRQVARQRYLSEDMFRKARHSDLADYFEGKWNAVKKPYTDKKGVSGTADRLVAAQPLVFKEDSTNTLFNLRKLSELPYQLVYSDRLDDLKSKALCNLMFLYQKLRAVGSTSVMEDFKLASKAGLSDGVLKLMRSVLMRSLNAITSDLQQLPLQLSARLISAGSKNQPEVKRLLLQCENPPFPCLLTRQGFLKGVSGTLVQKLVGHEIQVDNVGASADGTRVVTVGMDNLMKVWDVQEGKELTEINFSEDSPHAPWSFLFYDNNQTLVSSSMTSFTVWDLRSATCVKTYTVSNEFHLQPIPLARLADHGWILVLRETLTVFKEHTWEQVCEVKDLVAVKDEPHHQQRAFCGGLGKLAVLKLKGPGHFLIVDLAQYVKDKSGVTKVQVLDKGQAADKFVVQVGLTQDGKIPCIVYEADKYSGGNVCSFKVFSLSTGKLMKTFTGYDMGFIVGDDLMKVVDNSHVIMGNFIGTEDSTVIRKINIETGKFADVARVTRVCNRVVPLDSKRLLAVSATSATAVDVVTMNDKKTAGGKQAAKDVDDDDNLVEEKFDKQADGISPIPGNKRYLLSGYKNEALQIWDSARMKMVRDVKILGYTSLARMVDGDHAVTITHTNAMLVFDMKTPKNCGKQKRGLSGESAVDNKMGTGGGLTFLATAHGLEIRNVVKDTIVKIIPAGNIGLKCLLVSEDGAVVVGSPQILEKTNVVYVFDVKNRARLADIKFKSSECYMGNCALSWDGRYVVLPAGFPDCRGGIYDTNTGAGRGLPKYDEHADSISWGFSKATNSLVIGTNSGVIALYDLESLALIRACQITDDMISQMKVSADGRKAVSMGTNQSQVAVTDLVTGTIIGKVTADNTILGYRFSWNSEFLLMFGSQIRGITQLYLHQPSADGSEQGRQPQEAPNQSSMAAAFQALLNEPADFGTEMVTANFVE